MGAMNNTPDLVLMLIVLVAVGFLPLVALVTTSYLKIIVVLGLVRNAIGVQQVPPNMVLSGIALALSAFIMSPVVHQASQKMKEEKLSSTERLTPDRIARLADSVQQPLAAFLMRHTQEQDREFFLAVAKDLWKEDVAEAPPANSLLVLVPAFTTRELTRAFQMGFILYLAFIAVDLIIANIIQAFGLSMVSPTPIAIPFKLLLFVAFDGWQKLIYALVMSYQ
jgi:type III secretion protein R